MAKKSKKLQELQNLFDESDVDFSLVSDKRILKPIIMYHLLQCYNHQLLYLQP